MTASVSRIAWSDGAAGPVLAAARRDYWRPRQSAAGAIAAAFDAPPDSEDWRDRALCREVDPEIFFPEKKDGGSTAEAKMICRHCEVRAACRDYILAPENDAVSRFGVWAGLSERERRRLKREAA
jgi:WhiB family transcriptional regulator, redox-sensing transcriptional regulator